VWAIGLSGGLVLLLALAVFIGLSVGRPSHQAARTVPGHVVPQAAAPAVTAQVNDARAPSDRPLTYRDTHDLPASSGGTTSSVVVPDGGAGKPSPGGDESK
jgi:hypothetical protein